MLLVAIFSHVYTTLTRALYPTLHRAFNWLLSIPTCTPHSLVLCIPHFIVLLIGAIYSHVYTTLARALYPTLTRALDRCNLFYCAELL